MAIRARFASILVAVLFVFTLPGGSFAAMSVGTWSNYSGPTTDYMLRSVSMVSATDGWAVGMKLAPNGTVNGGVMLRWNGNAWQVYSSNMNGLFGVTMLSATDGWAVGQFFSGAAMILRWNGSNWMSVAVPNCSKRLNAVSMASASKGWAVGLDCIATWNGTSWATSTLIAANALDTVTAVSESEAWAFGYGALAHLTNGVWHFSNPILYDRYYSVSAVSGSNIWAAGSINGKLLHYDGTNWSVFTTMTGHSFYGIKMLSATDGWAVGDIIAHWDGTEWKQVSGPYSSSLWSADFKGFSGWAVGYDGKMLRYTAEPACKIFNPSIQR